MSLLWSTALQGERTSVSRQCGGLPDAVDSVRLAAHEGPHSTQLSQLWYVSPATQFSAAG